MWSADADDDRDDWEYSGEAEPEDDESETIPCPICGAEVYEDAEQCPACGNYFLRDTNPFREQSRSVAWLLLGLIGMAAVIVAMLLC